MGEESKEGKSSIFGAPSYVLQNAPGNRMLSVATTDTAKDVIVFSGPIIRCVVQRSADIDAVRIARAQFAISSFGLNITTLRITGILYAALICQQKATTTKPKKILLLYKLYCIARADNKDKRLYVTTDDDAVYQCVLTGMQRLLLSTRLGQQYAVYTLELLGVPYR